MRDLPLGAHAAVMALAGLGIAARAAAPALPGVLRAPAYFTEPWVAAAALAFVVLLALYLAKLVRSRAAVREELLDPAQLGFAGSLPVGAALLAAGVAPYLPSLANVLWWSALVVLLALQLWALSRWLSGALRFEQLDPGWLLLLSGGAVFPAAGIGLGNAEAARFAFGAAAAAAPLFTALVLARAVLGPPLHEALRPGWFLLPMPPALVYVGGLALYPGAALLESLYFFALPLAGALLVHARDLARSPFGPPWWAAAFGLDALAYAAARYAQDHPAPPWRAAAAVALALATLFVALALLRALHGAAARRS